MLHKTPQLGEIGGEKREECSKNSPRSTSAFVDCSRADHRAASKFEFFPITFIFYYITLAFILIYSLLLREIASLRARKHYNFP